ncbi:MAG: DUF1232 domain-containing protein [Deltaproteobacteria bacterium]|nr:DUF1232 domain-containing protein [Deltaproteobacteria bacterium]
MTTDKKTFGERISKSRIYEQAKGKASEIIKNPEKFRALLEKAEDKASAQGRGVLGEVWDTLATCLRMLKAYAGGQYREIPWKGLVAIVGAVIYFVMPLDFIPDFILGFGFVDDVALIAWTVKSIRTDIDRFAAWESDPLPQSETGPDENPAGKTQPAET